MYTVRKKSKIISVSYRRSKKQKQKRNKETKKQRKKKEKNNIFIYLFFWSLFSSLSTYLFILCIYFSLLCALPDLYIAL